MRVFFFVVRLGIIYYLKNKFVIGKEFSFIINKSIRKIIDLMKNKWNFKRSANTSGNFSINAPKVYLTL